MQAFEGFLNWARMLPWFLILLVCSYSRGEATLDDLFDHAFAAAAGNTVTALPVAIGSNKGFASSGSGAPGSSSSSGLVYPPPGSPSDDGTTAGCVAASEAANQTIERG